MCTFVTVCQSVSEVVVSFYIPLALDVRPCNPGGVSPFHFTLPAGCDMLSGGSDLHFSDD